YAELENWVEPLLHQDTTPLSRAKVLSALLSIATARDDAERLQKLGDELLPLARSIGADIFVCRALTALAHAAIRRGDVEQGQALYLEAIDLARTAQPALV